MAAREIVMVRKCFDKISFWPVDTGMFFMNAGCNMTVPQLNWYHVWSYPIITDMLELKDCRSICVY